MSEDNLGTSAMVELDAESDPDLGCRVANLERKVESLALPPAAIFVWSCFALGWVVVLDTVESDGALVIGSFSTPSYRKTRAGRRNVVSKAATICIVVWF